MYDYSKLLGAMREKGITQEVLSQRIGLNSTTLNQKLKNNSQFKQGEMYDILDCLDLPLSDIEKYFFCKQTCENARVKTKPEKRGEKYGRF